MCAQAFKAPRRKSNAGMYALAHEQEEHDANPKADNTQLLSIACVKQRLKPHGEMYALALNTPRSKPHARMYATVHEKDASPELTMQN